MDKLVIILPNDKVKTYRLLIVLMTIMNSVLLTLFRLRTPEDSLSGLIALGTVSSSIGSLIMNFFSQKNKDFYFNNMVISTLLSSLAWLLMGNIIAGLSLIFLSSMALKILKKLMVVFDKNGIDYPSFPRKKIIWSETENVQLKDNILTIDLKNNQLMQFTLNEKENPELDEIAFNDFVKKYI